MAKGQTKKEGTIEKRLLKDEKKKLVTVSDKGLEAITKFKLLYQSEEYSLLKDACTKDNIVHFLCDGKTVRAIPLALEYAHLRMRWHFLYFEVDDLKKVHSVPLFRIKNIVHLKKNDIDIPKELSEIVHFIIDSGRFEDYECIECYEEV